MSGNDRSARAIRLLVMAVACFCLTLLPAPAQTTAPKLMVSQFDPTTPLMVDGRIHASFETNGVIFVGGWFTRIGKRGGSIVSWDGATGRLEAPMFPTLGLIHRATMDPQGNLFLAQSYSAPNGGIGSEVICIKSDALAVVQWRTQIEPPAHISNLILSEGKLLAGGYFNRVGGEDWPGGFAAFDKQTGKLLPLIPISVSTGKRTSITQSPGLAASNDGKLYSARMSGDYPLEQMNLQTGEVSELGRLYPWTGAHPWVNSEKILAVLPDRLLMSIRFQSGDWPHHRYLIGIDRTSGAIVPAFSGAERVRQIGHALHAGDTIYLSGIVSVGTNRLADGRVVTNYQSGIASVNLSDGQYKSWNVNVRESIKHPNRPPSFVTGWIGQLALEGKRLFVAGRFNEFGGQPRNGLAALDIATGEVTDWSPNVLGISQLLTVKNHIIGTGNIMLDPVRRRGLTAIDAVTGRVLDWNPSPDGSVTNLFWQDGALWAQGSFTNINGMVSPHLARLDFPNAAGRTAGRMAGSPPTTPDVPKAAIQLTSRAVFIQVSPDFFSGNGGAGRTAANFEAQRVVLEASTNLVEWLPLATNSAAFVYEDAEAGKFPYRFYRTRPLR